MRIRALANGNVIHADDEAAKQLIEAGIYEEVKGDESRVGTNTTQPPQTKPAETKPAAKRRPKAR